MDDHIFWILKLNIKPGQHKNLKSLMADMTESVEADEPGALQYEWFVDSQANTCRIFEQYQDDSAVLTHMENFAADFADRFMKILEPERFVVYGEPGEKVQKVLSEMNPDYKFRTAGFKR